MMARWVSAIVAAMLIVVPAAAKDSRRLFQDTGIVRLTLKAPIGELTSTAAKVEEEVPGSLLVAGAKPETLAVALAPRGLKRRDRQVCRFPPLSVAFPSKPPDGSLFEGQKKLKLVTHCRASADFQQHILLEYAAYKLLNALTPLSHQVRLAMIDYVDAKGEPMVSRIGFFIEDTDDVAKRNGLREINIRHAVRIDSLEPRASARYALFQDMIGNLDWGMNAGQPTADCCHNSRLIGAKGATTGLVPVPYDFDYSGLVSTPYAVPPPQFKMANVRVRRYRGFCRHNGEATAEAARLRGEQAKMATVLRDVPMLEPEVRARAAAYVDSFFERIGTDAEVASNLFKTCI